MDEESARRASRSVALKVEYYTRPDRLGTSQGITWVRPSERFGWGGGGYLYAADDMGPRKTIFVVHLRRFAMLARLECSRANGSSAMKVTLHT